ncbi:MAG: cytidylyltransferase domain-containing protein [Acidimicrobiales bacterium]
MTVVALVPMRHNSERVPGKNYRMFGDAPLFHHVVRTLLSVGEVDEVLIDTDSPTIAEQCAAAFPTVRVIERPEHLRAGEIPMNTIIGHDLTHTDADVVLQTHSTNPLVRPETFAAGLRRFLDDDGCDSVFSVTRLQQRLWTADCQPVNHDPAVLLRTQDLAPLYVENSCFFVFSRALIAETGTRIGPHAAMVEMDPIEAMDIDEEPDFLLAEAAWRMRNDTSASAATEAADPSGVSAS